MENDRSHIILRRVYHKYGVNDEILFEVADDSFNLISIHKSEKLAKMKIKILKDIN